MAKKKAPIITHTEILVRAINSIEREINEMKKRCENMQGVERILQEYIDDRTPKLEALKTLYKIETGTEYI